MSDSEDKFGKVINHIRSRQQYIKTLICPVIAFQESWARWHKELLEEQRRPFRWVRNVNQTLNEAAKCTCITKVQMKLCGIPQLEDSLQPIAPHQMTCETLECISKLKSVESLGINTVVPLRIPEGMVLKAIRNMKYLQSVSLQNISHQQESVAQIHIKNDNQNNDVHCQADLGGFLSGLQDLIVLRMANCNCVDKRWGEVEWRSRSISTVSFNHCLALSSKTLKSILKQFQPSLRNLEYCHVKVPEIDRPRFPTEPLDIIIPSQKLTFPQLEILKLSGFSLDEQVIKIFEYSPKLSIAKINSPNIRAQMLAATLKHWGKLCFLESNVRGGPGSMDLILYCGRKGINLDEAFY